MPEDDVIIEIASLSPLLDGAAAVTVNSLTMNAGSLDIADGASLTVTAATVLDSASTVFLTNGGSLTPNGGLESAGTFFFDNGTLAGDSPVAFGGLAEILPGGAILNLPSFTNNGVINLAAAAVLLLAGGTAFTNAAGGSIFGNGTIDTLGGTLVNNGTINPGASPGTLTIDGDYEQGASGRFVAEVGEGGHDLLVINGSAIFAGFLDIVLLGGFLPNPGITLNFVSADSIVDAGIEITGRNYAGGVFGIFNLETSAVLVTFTADGDVIVDSDEIIVGDSGTGSLFINAGQDVGGGQGIFSSELIVGNLAGSQGTLLVAGADTALTIFGAGLIGNSGFGSLTVADGTSAEFISDNFDNLLIGAAADGFGSVTVTGPGSRLTTIGLDNTVQVGFQGFGLLDVSDGGLLETLFLSVGRGGVGVATLTGAGTRVVVSNDDGRFSDPFDLLAGIVQVGRDAGSSGSLSVLEGAVLEIRTGIGVNEDTAEPGLQIGQEAGSAGTVMVDGAGSRIEITQAEPSDPLGDQFGPFINVGRGGTGSLIIQNGAEVALMGVSSYVGVGRDTGSEGALLVQGGGSLTTLELEIGRNGSGTALITGPGTVVSVTSEFGSFKNPLPGVTQFASGFIRVGRDDGSSGLLEITDGARVEITPGSPGSGNENTINAGLQIARNFGSEGTVVVHGAGTVLELTQSAPDIPEFFGPFIQVGLKGQGHMTVSNGAQVNLLGPDAIVIISSDSSADLIGPPPGTPLEQSVFDILSGGRVLIDGGSGSSRFIISRQDGGDGLVRISGEGSSLELRGTDNQVVVGRQGEGTLEVSAGGTVSTLFFEVGTSGTGTATFTGAGSSLTVSSDGGRLSAPLAHVAGVALIGRNGGSSGVLNIEDGAFMQIRSGIGANEDTTVPSFQMGLEAGSLGVVNVTGAGSEIEVLQSIPNAGFGGPLFEIGRQGSATVNIGGGGAFVVMGPDIFATIGAQAGGTGTVIVDGAGSSLLIDSGPDSGQFYVGENGSGSLSVTGGATATVAATTASVGAFAGSDGTVLIEGAGSLLDIQNTLNIGPGGTGTVTVGSGGTLEAGTAPNDGNDDIIVGAGGTLQMQTGGSVVGDVLNAGGVLLAGASPGTASITGDLAQTSGTMVVEVAGIEPGLFDFYSVSGAADLDAGIIEFAFIDGFTPVEGDNFTFIVANGGLFANVENLSTLVSGLEIGFDYFLSIGTSDATFIAASDGILGNSLQFDGGVLDDSFVAGDGDDLLDGGGGSDTFTGGAGSDIFAIGNGDGGVTIDLADLFLDFEDGTDFIGLKGTLNLSDLTFQDTAAGAAIAHSDTGEFFAVLEGVAASLLDDSDFISV